MLTRIILIQSVNICFIQSGLTSWGRERAGEEQEWRNSRIKPPAHEPGQHHLFGLASVMKFINHLRTQAGFFVLNSYLQPLHIEKCIVKDKTCPQEFTKLLFRNTALIRKSLVHSTHCFFFNILNTTQLFKR